MPIFSNLKGGIQVEVIWVDQDVIEYQFRCSNGRFSGQALGEVESVALRIPIEAAGVDLFVAQVKRMHADQIGTIACLDMAG